MFRFMQKMNGGEEHPLTRRITASFAVSGLLALASFLLIASEASAQGPGRGRGRGFGAGGGRGPDAAMRADQDVFHYLLEHHAEIRRTVKPLEDGVETLTESDNPQVAKRIQEHVAAMHARVKSGQGLRFWDDLIVALFRHHAKIEMVVKDTPKGSKVVETSPDPTVVALIQAHAQVVSLFVAHGFDEAHKNHAVPQARAAVGGELVFPIIKEQGGVRPRPNAVEQPAAGRKVIFDVTADTKPTEPNKGLDRAARLLNLYGSAGRDASDIAITVVLHGEATKSILNDESYKKRFEVNQNPNLPLIGKLKAAGVEVLVCGQALNYKGFADNEVADGIPIAAAAMTAVINKQSSGYAYLPVP
ncbi:MAG: DsrE family protein [Planctomycetales bacterium]|nr:DsrE family protein [Planctomycetales bacterium]